MAEKKLNYTIRNYNECREAIREITRKYYPDVFENLDDASVGAWIIDLLSDIYDNLNFHIDRVFQETDVDSAQTLSSLMNLARTMGMKVPGKKAALCEVEISCELPLYDDSNSNNLARADEKYAPVVKRGTLFSDGMNTFELTYDVDFSEQFNSDGLSDRTITPTRDSNGNIVSYTYTKLAVVTAGQSKIYKQTLTASDIEPFMEVMIQDNDILGVDSIIVKQGTNLNTDPLVQEFSVDAEKYYDKNDQPVMRFFEVDNLIDQYRFGDVVDEIDGKPFGDESRQDGERYNYYNPTFEEFDSVEDITEYVECPDDSEEEKCEELVGKRTVPVVRVIKGEWKRLKNKFITEYTDEWNLRIIFGSGIRNKYGEIPSDAANFTRYMMSRMNANDYMGVLPESNTTLYVLYRVGGGDMSNIAAGTLNTIISSNLTIEGCVDDMNDSQKIRDVRTSLSVTNTTPSYGGKDEPTADELRYMIKYATGAQNRGVTVKDYYGILQQMPAKYGMPFRHCVSEENNKIVFYTLGLDYSGYLTEYLAETVADNMKKWLSGYKCVNDFIEFRSGKIINLSFIVTLYVDTAYEKGEVVKRVIDTIDDYMDIRRHQMGEDIYLGDLQKEISKLDGVENYTSMRVFNLTGNGYSSSESTMPLVSTSDCCYSDALEGIYENDGTELDLRYTDNVLVADNNSMFEIKYKNQDIRIIAKTR